MKETICRDIIKNSYYMISLFYNSDEIKNKKKEITNLKLQKMMYFVEAYYMVITKEPELFDSNWSAWDYGPVNRQLYNYYKKFGSMPIVLKNEEKNEIEKLPKINKDYIEKIFNIFSNFSAFELVTLTHLEKSPWSELYKKNQTNKTYDFGQLNDSDINKLDTQEWFKNEFNFLFKEENQ